MFRLLFNISISGTNREAWKFLGRAKKYRSCFMSFKFCLTVYFKGDLSDPIWRGGLRFFQVPEPIWGGRVSLECFYKFQSLYGGRGAQIFSKFQSLYWGKSLEFFQVPEPIRECQIQYIDIFLHIPSYFRHISSYIVRYISFIFTTSRHSRTWSYQEGMYLLANPKITS